jgi:hypothetical protein
MSNAFRSSKNRELPSAPENDSSEQSTAPTYLETHQHLRELAHRSSAGLEVTLLWDPARDELTVCGHDCRTGARFEIRPERRLALEVYYHPYRYVTREDIS